VCNSEIDREEDGERSSEGRADSGRKIALPRCPPLDSLDALDRQQQLDQERQRKPVPSPGARQTTQRGSKDLAAETRRSRGFERVADQPRTATRFIRPSNDLPRSKEQWDFCG
jgi:hypothetical protein